MDKETLEQLISDQPKEIRAQGILLFNAWVTCTETYRDAPTTANLHNMESAQSALSKFKDRITGIGEEDQDKPLPTIAAVLEYLKAEDWRVTRPSLYRHQKEGKIAPRRDGMFALRDVDKYARTFLKQKSTGKKLRDKLDEVQRKKADQELKNLELDYERKRFLHDRDLGRYIAKELMEIELAGRAGVLDAGLKHWVQSRAAEWIRAVGGDTKKVGELIVLMNHDLDEHINSYASPISYQVIIDAEDEPAEPEEMAREGESADEGAAPC